MSPKCPETTAGQSFALNGCKWHLAALGDDRIQATAPRKPALVAALTNADARVGRVVNYLWL
ncbi:MAG: hypothetical protein KA260_07095 [Burkholderiales bacterium]|nr:hypothetical protein [Burkholderiales bacterium]